MDPALFVQQNKKFLIALSLGGAVFLVGETLIGRTVGASLEGARRGLLSEKRKLGQPAYSSSALREVKARRDSVALAFEDLRKRVEFEPDPAFVLGGGPPTNQYLEVAAKTREALRGKAAAAGVEIDDRLGLPPVSPTAREEIRRTLRALDLVHRLVEHAIDSRVRRVEEIRIVEARGARRRGGEKGSGGFLDEVRVSLKATGTSGSLASFLGATQRGGRILPVGPGFSLARSAEREGEVVATLEFAAVEVHPEREP